MNTERKRRAQGRHMRDTEDPVARERSDLSFLDAVPVFWSGPGSDSGTLNAGGTKTDAPLIPWWRTALVRGVQVLAVGVAAVGVIAVLRMISISPPVVDASYAVQLHAVPAGDPAGMPAGLPAPHSGTGNSITPPGITSETRSSRVGPRIDPDWLADKAQATGIPSRALDAYATAALILATEQPGCGIGWNTLAGIGAIESGHGSYGGSMLSADGYPQPAIVGIPLDGNGVAAIPDTEGGVWDGDAVWDRAVGPMQFIPSTWARWGADGNGDGAADPNQIDDASLAAAHYLCHSGSMVAPEGWRAAVFSYNHLDSYVDSVAVAANTYVAAAGGN